MAHIAHQPGLVCVEGGVSRWLVGVVGFGAELHQRPRPHAPVLLLAPPTGRSFECMLCAVCGGSKQQIGPHQWPGRRSTLPAQAWGLGSVNRKLVGEVGVCAKALQQRTRLVSTIRCHPTQGVSRIILDCIHGLLMCVAGNVIVLSSIKIGAPASNGGRWHHFWTYGASL
jgi:hypothetical protein